MNPATNPMISIPRSRFKQPFTHTTSFLHGDIIPIDCFEVLPGDDFSVHKAAAEIIMSTPIAPIFGNIKVKAVAMYVPTRLLWTHTEEFFGANKTSAGPQQNVYKIPQRSLYLDAVGVRSVSHYLGKPYIASPDSAKAAAGFGKASVLKERAYWFIWSEWYRQQQVQDPFIMNTSDSGLVGTVSGVAKGFYDHPAKCCKQWDMFTAATLAPQYGAAVTLPLGTYAPVKVASASDGVTFLNASDLGGTLELSNAKGVTYSNDDQSSSEGKVVKVNGLVTDLSTATAAKINDIRYAFQLQKYLERANFGTRSRL